MQEGRGQEVAFIGQIEVLDATSSAAVKASFVDVPTVGNLTNDTLWKLRVDLDIQQFEFARNHWAIKNRDVIGVLTTAGLLAEQSSCGQFENRTLPAPPRSDLIRARDVISERSHTDIDDLLLEAGVPGLVAGRDIGGRRERANAIIRYAIDNPAATTDENSLLSVFLMRSANLASASDGSPLTEGVGSVNTPVHSGRRERLAGTVPNRVFVVHGRNEQVRNQVVDFLDGVGLESIVLHDQPNMGRHLLTKFIDEADLATFAVVLMTDDDVGGLDEESLAPRARQNVILELGYFLAHLRQERVCALVTPGLEAPSDFDGIVFLPMDATGDWKSMLQRELLAAGLPVRE